MIVNSPTMYHSMAYLDIFVRIELPNLNSTRGIRNTEMCATMCVVVYT